MSHYHVRGFPLDTRNTRENEVSLTLFSLEQGKIGITVKGTKKKESTLRPALDPHCEGHYFITERRTSDLLREWEPLNWFFEIRRDLGKIALAGYLARLVMEFAPSRTPDVNLYFFFRNIFFLMRTGVKHDIIKPLIEWGFLRVMGMAPSLECCAVCGEDSGPEFRFDISGGRLLCSRCGSGAGGAHMARLGLRSADFGKKTDMACRRFSGPLESPAEREAAFNIADMELSPFSRHEKEEFSSVARKFSRYHLRDEVGGWLLGIGALGPSKR